MAAKKIAIIGKQCVACGRCVRECPLGALSIYKGLRARVEAQRCVGCGKCEKVCPAAIIEIKERQVTPNAEKALV